MPGAFGVGNATDDLHFLVDGLRCDDLVVTDFALAPRVPTGDGRVVFDVALEGSLRCATNAIHFTRAPVWAAVHDLADDLAATAALESGRVETAVTAHFLPSGGVNVSVDATEVTLGDIHYSVELPHTHLGQEYIVTMLINTAETLFRRSILGAIASAVDAAATDIHVPLPPPTAPVATLRPPLAASEAPALSAPYVGGVGRLLAFVIDEVVGADGPLSFTRIFSFLSNEDGFYYLPSRGVPAAGRDALRRPHRLAPAVDAFCVDADARATAAC